MNIFGELGKICYIDFPYIYKLLGKNRKRSSLSVTKLKTRKKKTSNYSENAFHYLGQSKFPQNHNVYKQTLPFNILVLNVTCNSILSKR